MEEQHPPPPRFYPPRAAGVFTDYDAAVDKRMGIGMGFRSSSPLVDIRKPAPPPPFFGLDHRPFQTGPSMATR